MQCKLRARSLGKDDLFVPPKFLHTEGVKTLVSMTEKELIFYMKKTLNQAVRN